MIKHGSITWNEGTVKTMDQTERILTIFKRAKQSTDSIMRTYWTVWVMRSRKSARIWREKSVVSSKHQNIFSKKFCICIVRLGSFGFHFWIVLRQTTLFLPFDKTILFPEFGREGISLRGGMFFFNFTIWFALAWKWSGTNYMLLVFKILVITFSFSEIYVITLICKLITYISAIINVISFHLFLMTFNSRIVLLRTYTLLALYVIIFLLITYRSGRLYDISKKGASLPTRLFFASSQL